MNERPGDLSPNELRFEPQSAVRWLSTRVLASTAAHVLFAKALGGYVDKRELQALNDQNTFDHTSSNELWLDFIADSGDGFDATYSVAYLASQAELNPREPLPRGDILVLGGDQVYPSANWRDYENRFKGPFQAAMPAGDGALYAIPGNHDWYDGLTSFLRLFGAGRNIGGRGTYQSRSYFAAKLPHNWWLVGIDAQFDAYLDGPQLDYFTDALQDMNDGDPVMLCVPRPAWTWTDADPRAYDKIDYFIRTFIETRGGQVPIIITGDLHHYAHYQEINGPRHLVTAGGGGAYLAPTHTLPERLEAPPPDSMARHGSPVRMYRRGVTYPSKARSWREGFGIFHRLPLRNPSFGVLLGVIHLLGLLSFLASPGTAVAAGVLTTAITVGFAAPSEGPRTPRYWIASLCHAAAHIGLFALGYAAWRYWDLGGWWAYLGYIPVSGLAAGVVVAAYLLVASAFKINGNELFAGQCIDDYKCFLRMKVTREGLTVYPIAVPKVGRKWRANPHGEEEEPWIVPDKPIRTRYIEEPFTIPGRTTDQEPVRIPDHRTAQENSVPDSP